MTKSLRSKNGPKNFPPEVGHEREAEIELIDKRVKLVIAEGIKKWGRIAGITLTSLLLLLGLDKVSLQNRVGEAIHLALFGNRYEGGTEQTQSARSMLDVLLAQQENQYFEFLWNLRLDTWSDSDRALFKSLENVRADLTKAQQRVDPTAFAQRLARHGEYIDMLASYQIALLGSERERLFEEAWNKVKKMEVDRPSTREKATVAMLKGLVLRGHLINSGYKDDLQEEVDRLVSFVMDLPIEHESGRLVLKARNVAALLRLTLTQAQFDSKSTDPKPEDYTAWVSGSLAAIRPLEGEFWQEHWSARDEGRIPKQFGTSEEAALVDGRKRGMEHGSTGELSLSTSE